MTRYLNGSFTSIPSKGKFCCFYWPLTQEYLDNSVKNLCEILSKEEVEKFGSKIRLLILLKIRTCLSDFGLKKTF